MKNGKTFEEFEAVATKILEAKLSEYDPWIYRYYHSLQSTAGVKQYVRYLEGKLAFAGVDVKGLAVLDAGCGFGLALVLLGILGAREMHGFDLYDNMVNTIRSYEKLLPDHLAKRLKVEQADASKMPYESARFDLVTSIEAISHYLDEDAFLREAHRVLKPGGMLLISDGNNERNPSVRRDTIEIWDAFEQGEVGQHVHGHVIEMPFVKKRERLIREQYPKLADEAVLALARGTSGLTRDQILQHCDTHLATGELPSGVYERGTIPVDPIKGDVIERLFDPYELAKRIERLGFRTRVTGYWGGASGKPHLVAANKALSMMGPLTISTAGEFRIAAQKL